jgi:hypothetical protein
MNATLDPQRLPRMRVNLSVVRGHYAYATRPHTPTARRAAYNVAIRDIPALVAEIERLWELACDRHQRYTDLRAAALATLAAADAGEPDPWFYLRDELHARSAQPPRSGRRR